MNRVTVCTIEDTIDRTRWVQGIDAAHDDVMVIDVPPLATVHHRDVAEALLTAMGKDHRLRLAMRPAGLLAAAWLPESRATDAIVLNAPALPTPILDDLVAQLDVLDKAVWLFVPVGEHHDTDERNRTIEALRDRYEADLVDCAELAATWHSSPAPREEPPQDHWPTVPRVDGIFFRQYLHTSLEPADASRVDQYFCTTAQQMARELHGHTPRAGVWRFQDLLRDRMHAAVHDEELVTLVRAAQVAGISAQLHVQVDPIRLHAGLATVPRQGHAVRDNWWDRLDRYPDPDVPAVAALHIAGIDLTDIAKLSTHDIDQRPDALVTVTASSGNQVTLEGQPATYLRAANSLRHLGAGPGPLFSTHRADGISNKRLGDLARLSKDVGVDHTGNKAHRVAHDPERWLANFGITIQRLNSEGGS